MGIDVVVGPVVSTENLSSTVDVDIDAAVGPVVSVKKLILTVDVGIVVAEGLVVSIKKLVSGIGWLGSRLVNRAIFLSSISKKSVTT